MKSLVSLLFFSFTIVVASSPASAQVLKPAGDNPWYMNGERPATLSEALSKEKEYLGEDNPGYTVLAGVSICDAFVEVGLSCDYNTRLTLSNFLTACEKGLFPATARTNPFCSPNDSYVKQFDDCYIGTAQQNLMLLDAIRRNAGLFKNGDLTAEDVRAKWH